MLRKWMDTDFRIITVLVVLAGLSAGSAFGRELVVAVAELQGPDPDMVPVTETVCSWLTGIGGEESVFRVERLEGDVTSENLEDVLAGIDPEAFDLVVYGMYDLPGASVRLVMSSACTAGSRAGQSIHFHLDQEGMLLLDEVVPGSEPPERIQAMADLMAAYAWISLDSLDLAGVHLDMALVSGDELTQGIAAVGYGLRSHVQLMAGDPAGALEDAERALALYPDEPLLYHYRGGAHELLGDFAAALADYRTVREIGVPDPENLYNLSRMYQEAGLTDSALACIDTAIALVPDEPVYLNSRAFIHNHLREYDLAVEDISRALEINPEYPTGWANLACAQRELGLYGEAIESFTRGMEFQSDPVLFGSYQRDRGYCYSRVEEYGAAIEDYREGMALAGGSASNHAFLGWLLMQIGDYGSARDELDTVLEMDPRDPEILCTRGKCSYLLRDLEAAIEDYSMALGMDPVGFDDYEYLGKAYAEHGDLEAAIELFTRGAERSEIQEEKAWFLSYRAICYWEVWDLESAAADYGEAVDILPEEPYFQFKLGEVYWLMDREPEAVPRFNEAIRLGLEDIYMPGCLLERGRSYILFEDYPAAIEDLTAALEYDPDYAEAIYFRGKAYYLNGDYIECRNDMQHYLAVGLDDELRMRAELYIQEISGR